MCFEELEVWKLARSFVKDVYALTRKGDLAKDYGLKDQIQRAAVSVITNIAGSAP
ncbi:MAG: four helix bundle protein [Verrucomicrobia bacterium]|nr:four helix bundle protein [Verrucomicrobiota bacterium]